MIAWRAAALALAGLVVVAGCGFAPTDLMTVIERPGYSFFMRVYDDTGLVTEVTPGPAPEAAPDGTATAHPDTETLDVGWVGGACNRTPIIQVSGSASDLLITIQPDATDELWPQFEACPAVGILLTATLHLNAPVLQENVRMEIHQ
jgi:hypothetical protein